MRARWIAVVVCAAFTRVAHADCPEGQTCFAVSEDLGQTGWQIFDATHEPRPAFHELILAGVRTHFLVDGLGPLAYVATGEMELGFTLRRAGFAYDLGLLPIGVGWRCGAHTLLGIAAGIGASGSVGNLDDAITLPVEAFLDIAVHRRARLVARVRTSFILGGAPSREAGAPSLPTSKLGDEFEAMIAIRRRRLRRPQPDVLEDSGRYWGVAYREWLGARFLGIVLGTGVAASFHDR